MASKYLPAKSANNKNWLLFYDNENEIQELYFDYELYNFNLMYTAQNVKKGSELLTHSKNLMLPDDLNIKGKIKNIKIMKIEHNL